MKFKLGNGNQLLIKLGIGMQLKFLYFLFEGEGVDVGDLLESKN